MNAQEAIERVPQAVADLEIDLVAARVRDALQAGAEPRRVLNDGLSAGVQVVGAPGCRWWVSALRPATTI
jgi:methanogenic corrinoid protein MtbC1